jgi:L-rhamnonate dehydratase
MYTSGVLYGRRGVFAMALSAVDNALWDIAGKHAGQPVYELLGGATRDRISIYQTGGDVAEGKARGVRHFKRSLPIGPHTSAAEMDRRVESVLAAELVQRIGGGGPGWTKVACGEHEYTEHGFDVLIRLNSAEILQPDITWCGGTTAGRRIARLVDAAGLEIIPHRGGSSWGFPIALTSPSCTMAESFPAGSTILDAMSCTVENGEVIAPTGPGFGTTLTEELVLEHRLTAA